MTYARGSEGAVLAPIAGLTRAHESLVAALVTYGVASKRGDVSVESALVPYALGASAIPRVSELAMLVAYSTAEPVVTQSRAWTFTMDGHTWYVLDLGQQGTFLYDTGSQSWCKYETQGFAGWNLRNGTMWNTGASRVVGGDTLGPYVWELDPLKIFDDDFRDVAHAASAAITLRSRVYKSMSELRVAMSAGLLDDTTGAAFVQLTYSDDDGQTYSAPIVVQLLSGTTPDGQQDIRFPSLGSFMAPGRIMQIADVGGALRLDGADAMIDNYDEEEPVAPGT